MRPYRTNKGHFYTTGPEVPFASVAPASRLPRRPQAVRPDAQRLGGYCPPDGGGPGTSGWSAPRWMRWLTGA